MQYSNYGLRMKLSLERAYLAYMKSWVWSPIPHKQGVQVQVYHLSTWEVEAGEPEAQSPPQLHSEFETRLQYTRLWSKKQTSKNKLYYSGIKASEITLTEMGDWSSMRLDYSK